MNLIPGDVDLFSQILSAEDCESVRFAQLFYRQIGYKDTGALLGAEEALEIIVSKSLD